MSWEERKEILEAVKGVKKVVAVDDTDGTVCEALKREKPTYFANGGDRSDKNTPELTVCRENNITMIWGIGGGKIQSSSELVNRLRKAS
jgi:D-beta-D-heptose 7-phosphate kinase/D-beta-D-heptose 1-phosphate adenosyltransferase